MLRNVLQDDPMGMFMRDTDEVKWALIDLLKLLDVIHGGEHHEAFNQIARKLGVELPPPPDVDEEVEV